MNSINLIIIILLTFTLFDQIVSETATVPSVQVQNPKKASFSDISPLFWNPEKKIDSLADKQIKEFTENFSKTPLNSEIVDRKIFSNLKSNHSIIDEIEKLLTELDVKFEKKLELIKTGKNITDEEIKNIQNLMEPESLEKLIANLYENGIKYLDEWIAMLKEKREYFSTKMDQPEQVILYKILTNFLYKLYKGVTMQKFVNLVEFKNGESSLKDSKMKQKAFEEYLVKCFQHIKNAFLSSGHTLYKLDPENHIKGVTYEEITRFDQIYFTSEMNFDHCNNYCEDYTKPRHNFIEKYAKNQRVCGGTIHECVSEHTSSYYIWLANSTEDKRYDYVASRVAWDRWVNFAKYGNESNTRKNQKIAEFTGWTYWFSHCDVCRCRCDEENDPASIRSFSLEPVTSDVEKNMVITGVQLKQKNKIFVLEIQQAELLPLGKIKNESAVWKESNPPKDAKQIFKLKYNRNKLHIGSANNDPKKHSDFVVTGIQFIVNSEKLALEVTLTRFDIHSGKLLDQNQVKNVKKVTNSLSNNEMTSIQHDNRPILYKDNKRYTRHKHGVVKFVYTNLQDDIGQSTVPFLDVRPVSSGYAALTGVGLEIRTRENSGGFIMPTLTTYPMYIESILAGNKA